MNAGHLAPSPVAAAMLDRCMTMPPGSCKPGFGFGSFVLQRWEHQLLKDGQPVELGTRALDVLLLLAESNGALVTKEDVLDRVWGKVAVEENNIQVQVCALRRVLGPDRNWIVTVPGRGYRFTAPVVALDKDEDEDEDRAETGATPRMSILVLPLAARGEVPGQDWFADSVTDSLTTDLARALPGSTVVAQTTADTYRNHHADVREIGRQQGVRFVLEGSILLTDDHVRVNAQLIEVATGTHVWAERFDKARLGVFRDQDEIVARLAREVGLQMIGAEARRAEQLDGKRPEQSKAADFVLRGHAAARQRAMTRESAETACALYTHALQRNPNDADALAGIASVQVYQVVNGFTDAAGREATLVEAAGSLAKALLLAPDHQAALKTRAVLLRARGAFAEALEAAFAIVDHNPGDPAGYRETGLDLLYLGRTQEATEWFRRVDALAPADPTRWTWLQGLGRSLIQLGRAAEAIPAFRLAIESNPNHPILHALLAAALALTGDAEHARQEMATFHRAEPGVTMDALAQRSAVPIEATDAIYRARNERLREGLERASRT